MELNKIYASEIAQFTEMAHETANRYHLVKCSSGNISWRTKQHILLSQTGSWLAELQPEQVAILDPHTGETCNGVQPTMEKNLHIGVLKNRSDFNVVLHTQSPFATAVACLKNPPEDFNVIIEMACYIGTPSLIHYLQPGSIELAEAVAEAFKNHNVALLANHGVVVGGKDFREALQRALFFELACEILIHTQGNRRTLSKKEANALENYVKSKTC